MYHVVWRPLALVLEMSHVVWSPLALQTLEMCHVVWVPYSLYSYLFIWGMMAAIQSDIALLSMCILLLYVFGP
jgi:hypothetical protein